MFGDYSQGRFEDDGQSPALPDFEEHQLSIPEPEKARRYEVTHRLNENSSLEKLAAVAGAV